jgi:transposase
MEGRQRRSFTDDYKRQAVDLVASSGRSIGSVAKELGLRDSVLRRWVELRHALMTMIAYAFLQSRRLKAAGRKKKNLRTATTTKHAGHQASDPRPLRTTSTPTMSSL